MLNRWKNAHLGDIFKGLVPLVPLEGHSRTPDSDAFSQEFVQCSKNFPTPQHRPILQSLGEIGDEQKEVLDGVGMGWNHNMNWASRASRGGNFHERPVQNEKICVRSVPDRLRVKETIS